jgi:hypothetical protein
MPGWRMPLNSPSSVVLQQVDENSSRGQENMINEWRVLWNHVLPWAVVLIL